MLRRVVFLAVCYPIVDNVAKSARLFTTRFTVGLEVAHPWAIAGVM